MQLHYNFPGTGPVIKITDNNLLPTTGLLSDGPSNADLLQPCFHTQ